MIRITFPTLAIAALVGCAGDLTQMQRRVDHGAPVIATYAIRDLAGHPIDVGAADEVELAVAVPTQVPKRRPRQALGEVGAPAAQGATAEADPTMGIQANAAPAGTINDQAVGADAASAGTPNDQVAEAASAPAGTANDDVTGANAATDAIAGGVTAPVPREDLVAVVAPPRTPSLPIDRDLLVAVPLAPVANAKGAPVTWGRFRQATGVAKVICAGERTRISLTVNGLIARGLYCASVLSFAAPGFAAAGLDALGRRIVLAGTFRADALGGARLEAEVPAAADLPGCLFDADEVHVVLSYRARKVLVPQLVWMLERGWISTRAPGVVAAPRPAAHRRCPDPELCDDRTDLL